MSETKTDVSANLGDYLTNGGPGRAKGSKNKITKTLKEAVKLAFDEVGGVDYLVSVAQQDPKTFMQILAKLIPTEVNQDVKTTMRIVTGIQRVGDNGANAPSRTAEPKDEDK